MAGSLNNPLCLKESGTERIEGIDKNQKVDITKRGGCP
jgi:hypothetical protein